MSSITRTAYSQSKRMGCPTCDGNHPKSCLRCFGKTRLCDWWGTNGSQWEHRPDITKYIEIKPVQETLGWER